MDAVHRYSTRNHAFVPAVTWIIAGDLLIRESTQAPAERIALREVAELRLDFSPTRVEPARFRCRVKLRNGLTHEFFNRAYESLMSFREDDPGYLAFVDALVAALARHSPGCVFAAGATVAVYRLSVIAVWFLALVLIAAGVMFIVGGVPWIVAFKLVLILAFAPVLKKWFRQNRPRTFTPSAVPADVLPERAEVLPPPLTGA